MIKNYLLSKNIKHEITTSRAEQNRFIERQNRTIVESAKSIQRSYHCIYRLRKRLLKN